MNKGFDQKKFVQLQIEEINNRIGMFSQKLYMEFGGKIFDDLHASRVLPGYDPNGKIKILQKLKDKTEMIFVISAKDIEKNTIRADYDLSYSADMLRLIDKIRKLGIKVTAIVITLFEGQQKALNFKKMLESRGERVYVHTKTKGYPLDVDTIVSDEGYGQNPYIETTMPLVVVTAPGPGSGKLGTCLSQLYHEYKRGVMAGYAKFETFPVWNIPLKSPINIAYEAATLNLKDINMIDPFYLYSKNKTAINYNRDIEQFPLLQSILKKITGKEIYSSPTEMGVNMVGFGITDEKVCAEASKQEIIRRYLHAKSDVFFGKAEIDCLERAKQLMDEVEVGEEDRPVVVKAREKLRAKKTPCVAIQLSDGRVVTGKTTNKITASSACVLNAIKTIAKINDKIKLISESKIKAITKLKEIDLNENNNNLNISDVLTCLSLDTENTAVEDAFSKIPELRNLDAHSTCVLSEIEKITLKKLGLNITFDPLFPNENLYLD